MNAIEYARVPEPGESSKLVCRNSETPAPLPLDPPHATEVH